MTMEHVATPHKRAAVAYKADGDDDAWPQVTLSAKVSAFVRGQGVTLGWRLKNAGLEKVGLWLVHASIGNDLGASS